MLIVDFHPTDPSLLTVKFNYFKGYIDRIRLIDGAVFVPLMKVWTIPNQSSTLAHFESMFNDEIVYKTPEWIIKELPTPSYTESSHQRYLTTPFRGIPQLKLPLKKYQEVGVKILLGMIRRYNFAICADGVGLGKALFNSTNVLTTNGWKQICHLDLNDLIYGEDGKPYNVLGIYPQGLRETYKVTFSDHSEIICDGEHLWNYQTKKDRDRKKDYKTATLSNIMNLPLYHTKGRYKEWNIYIPMTSPVEFNERQVNIDPYILGLLLGDGGFTSNPIKFSSSEVDIVESVSKWCIDNHLLLNSTNINDPLCIDYRISGDNQGIANSNNLTRYLRDLGLIEHGSPTKFIPNDYLYNSIKNRIALLSGLIDTDGEVINSWIVFSSTSIELANGVKFLVESLGGTATFANRQTSFTYKGVKKEGLPSYRLNIKMQKDILPFRSIKHKNSYKVGQSEARRTIRSIELHGQEECTCICVNSPNNLFLIDNFIPTHNTAEAITVMKYLWETGDIGKVLIVSKKSLKAQWKRDGIEKFLNHADSMIISGDVKKRMKQYDQFDKSKCSILIVNYQTVMNDYTHLYTLGFDMIIIDEAHKVATRTGVMNKAIRSVVRHCSSKVLFLTGTPILSTPEDLYGIVQIASDNEFLPWPAFQTKYIVYDKSSRFERLVGYRNLSELKERVQGFTLRRTEYEVDVELPEMSYSRIDVDQDTTQETISAKIKDSVLETMAKLENTKDPTALEQLNNNIKMLGASRQAVADDPRLFAMSKSKMIAKEYGDMVDSKYIISPKTETLIDLVQNIIDGGDKVIIFTKFERAARMLCEDIAFALKTGVVTYTGQIDDDKRDENVQKFWIDPDVTVFISTDAGSEGLNLQVARYIINYDQPDNPGIKTQRFGRVRRLGSVHKHVTMYDLITLNSMDEEKLKSLESKESLFEQVIGLDKAESEAVKKQLSE